MTIPFKDPQPETRMRATGLMRVCVAATFILPLIFIVALVYFLSDCNRCSELATMPADQAQAATETVAQG